MAQDFAKGKIYKITNDFNDDVYIGSTCDRLVKRFAAHKAAAKQEKYINIPLYKLINELGFQRFRIQLIEEFPCNDKYELRQREGHYIRELSKNLNKNIAGRTEQEKDKQYYKDNKEKIKENNKEYRDNNKEKIKNYYEKNKEQILEKIKNYYKDNKEKIKINAAIKINCVCGSCFCKGKLSSHNKTKKHIEFINNNNSSESQIE